MTSWKRKRSLTWKVHPSTEGSTIRLGLLFIDLFFDRSQRSCFCFHHYLHCAVDLKSSQSHYAKGILILRFHILPFFSPCYNLGCQKSNLDWYMLLTLCLQPSCILEVVLLAKKDSNKNRNKLGGLFEGWERNTSLKVWSLIWSRHCFPFRRFKEDTSGSGRDTEFC